MNAILQDVPLPARLVPWHQALPTTLTRCVLLAVLLHVWLIVLLGNAPGGTAPQGQGVWGAINVSLRGPVTEGAAEVRVPAPPANTTPGDAPVPRYGGSVRSAEPAPDSVPGAAQLGQQAVRPAPVLASPVEPDKPSATASVAEPAASLLPLPERTPERIPERALEREPAARADPEPPVMAPAAAMGRLTPPAPAARVAEPALPQATTALPLAAALPALPPPAAVLAAPRAERQLASPLQQALSAPPAAALPLAVAPAVLPELATPPPLADAPQPVRTLQAPLAAAVGAQPALQRSAERQPLVLPSSSALPGAQLPTPLAGSADAGARVGHDVATPAAAAASTPPRLNLELARPRGGELSRTSTGGVLPVLPRPPERDEKLAREIEKSGKTDCRNAYSALGPLAVIPLAVDAVRKDGGCKW